MAINLKRKGEPFVIARKCILMTLKFGHIFDRFYQEMIFVPHSAMRQDSFEVISSTRPGSYLRDIYTNGKILLLANGYISLQ